MALVRICGYDPLVGRQLPLEREIDPLSNDLIGTHVCAVGQKPVHYAMPARDYFDAAHASRGMPEQVLQMVKYNPRTGRATFIGVRDAAVIREVVKTLQLEEWE